MKKESIQSIRARAIDQKKVELLTALTAHLEKLFAGKPELRELRLTAREFVRMICAARMPVWTWSDSQLCKLVHDAISNGMLPSGRNEFGSDGRRTGNFIFVRGLP